MAKRELSSTLRNLKFMQRVAQKEEKAKKEEEAVVPNGNFPSRSGTRKCVVIVEGDPHPEVMRGRMSFLNFNPSIDKLNDEASNSPQNGAAATSSGRESETRSDRGDSSAQVGFENLQTDNSSSGLNGEHKRKQGVVSGEALYPHKSQKNIQGHQTSSSHGKRSPEKQSRRDKLDWNVLRPLKSQNKKKQGRHIN